MYRTVGILGFVLTLLCGVAGAAPVITVANDYFVIPSGHPIASDVYGTTFGPVNNGGTFIRIYTVYNRGNQILDVTDIDVTGGGAAAFTVLSSTSFSLGAGQSTPLQVQYQASIASGFQTATLDITSNDPTDAIYDFALEGEAVAGPLPLAVSANVSELKPSKVKCNKVGDCKYKGKFRFENQRPYPVGRIEWYAYNSSFDGLVWNEETDLLAQGLLKGVKAAKSKPGKRKFSPKFEIETGNNIVFLVRFIPPEEATDQRTFYAQFSSELPPL